MKEVRVKRSYLFTGYTWHWHYSGVLAVSCVSLPFLCVRGNVHFHVFVYVCVSLCLWNPQLLSAPSCSFQCDAGNTKSAGSQSQHSMRLMTELLQIPSEIRLWTRQAYVCAFKLNTGPQCSVLHQRSYKNTHTGQNKGVVLALRGA